MAMTNLELLREARNQYEKLSTQEAFEAYFIGHLSNSMDRGVWVGCLKLAKNDVAMVQGISPEVKERIPDWAEQK